MTSFRTEGPTEGRTEGLTEGPADAATDGPLLEGMRARLAAVEARIAAACQDAGRPRGDVRLIAVSKEQPLDRVLAALTLGLRDLAESRAHALAERVAALGAHPEAAALRWHMIGPVQSRKARELAALRRSGADLTVQTLDRPSLLSALEAQLDGPPLPVLLQVNVDAEPQKAGCAMAEVDPLVDRIAASPHLSLRGLMAIPAPCGEASLRRAFAALRGLGERIADRVPRRVELSMGMSDDFPLAIAEGATMIRVGSALFGPRR